MKDIATIQEQITQQLKKAGDRGLDELSLARLCHLQPPLISSEELRPLLQEGTVLFYKKRYYDPAALNLFPARIVFSSRKYSIGIRLEDQERFFIPSRFSKGVLAGDFAFLRPLPHSGENDGGGVFAIYSKSDQPFTGTLLKEFGNYYIQANGKSKDPLYLRKESVGRANPGEKIVAKIRKRKEQQSDHVCELVGAYGNPQSAAVCSRAILDANEVTLSFPDPVLKQAEEAAHLFSQERSDRADLTHLTIFTIDSTHSKDLDDAVSIQKTAAGYRLGVHIADVSHYVRPNTPLDEEALARGTSIYYANKVIPMLPEALSNGICSLNPNEDRLAFSAWIDLDDQGNTTRYSFEKSIIRSRIKGVYAEINAILANRASDSILQKYEKVSSEISLLYQLYQKLHANKIQRGAPQLETTESDVLVDEKDNVVDIRPHRVGISEGIIEECMLLANEAAAMLASEAHLPFIYRIHEKPSPDKVASLKETLKKLGFSAKGVDPNMKPRILANILEAARNTELFEIVNMNVLRSMAKARYDAKPVGHYGLALKNYAHFTSPIRRYPDLMIHRILSEYLQSRKKVDAIQKHYGRIVSHAALQSSEMENRAVRIERTCEACYKAEYMRKHIGEPFEGTITSVLERGMYITLPNTVEGYIKTWALDGDFEYDGFSTLRNPQNGQSYRVGQKIQVVCTAADVSSAYIDFALIDQTKNNESKKQK